MNGRLSRLGPLLHFTMDLSQMQSWKYLPDIPKEIDQMRAILRNYSKVPADEVDQHLHRVVRLLFASFAISLISHLW